MRRWYLIVLLLLMNSCTLGEEELVGKGFDTGRMGLTWGKVSHDDELGIDLVGCHGQPRVDGTVDGLPCNTYLGDTSCSIALPILCLRVDDSPRPGYALQIPNYAVEGRGQATPPERGWAGGYIGLTEPVRGTDLTSLEKANEICRASLGEGYRMAEHSDGKYIMGMGEDRYYNDTWPSAEKLMSGKWHWYAYGNIRNDTRFWVHIQDQPGNCWDELPPEWSERDFLTVSDVWQNAESFDGKLIRVRAKPRFSFVPYHPMMKGGCVPAQYDSPIGGELKLIDRGVSDPRFALSIPELQCEGSQCSVECQPFSPGCTARRDEWPCDVIEAFEFVGILRVDDGQNDVELILENIDLSQSRRSIAGEWESIPTGIFGYSFP